MDSKDEIKKKSRKSKSEKDKKKSTKAKRGKRTKKETKTFVQKTPVDTGVPSGTGGITGGRDILGAGGLPSLLQALGVKGRFQGLNTTTGFGAPSLQPVQAPVIQRAPVVAPRLEDRIIEGITHKAREISPQEDVMREEQSLRKLERAFRGLTREELVTRINQYFGDEGLDYVVKDEILSKRSKKGMLEQMANMEGLYGNININRFIEFIPEEEDIQSYESSIPNEPLARSIPQGARFVDGTYQTNGFTEGGDNVSALSMPALETGGAEGESVVELPEEAD